MARPPTITDDQIIEAGEKISATQAVNATRLWRECGRQGRPDRLLAIWAQHEAGKQAEADVDHLRLTGVPIPEKAQQQATALKLDLSSGIDRVLLSMYSALEESLSGRYQAELAEMNRTREACLFELHDAHGVIEELSDANRAAQDRVSAIEAACNDALIARNVGEALRAAAVEENARLAARLRQAEKDLKHELFEHGEAKAATARAEVANEAARRSLEEITKRLQDAQAELAQAQQASASLRDDNVRQGEAIASKDLEIGRFRETAASAETAVKAWMERALIAERPPASPPAPPSPSSEKPVQTRVRRRRLRTGPDRRQASELGSPDSNGLAAPPPLIGEVEQSSDARPPR